MDKDSITFLEGLSNAPGPSGFEREAVAVLHRRVEGYADEICTDKMGSLVISRKGKASTPVILLPAHIDEIGFVVSSISSEGFLTFNPLGYWWDQTLIGQKVVVLARPGPVRGVIVSPHPYTTAAGSIDKVITKDAMFIDIGASNREEVASMGVRVGDPAVPDSGFFTMQRPRFRDGQRLGERTIAFGKAFDNRIGTFLAAELIRLLAKKKVKHPNRVVAAATVQEETWQQGARTVAHMMQPDVAIALDVDVAGDIPGVGPANAPTRLGEGVSITTWDTYMVPNQPLKELCIDICERKGIPYQLSHAKGGTDAGAIHATGIGVPSIAIGPPVRHMHSHVSVADLQDIDDTLRFLVELIKALDQRTVDSFTGLPGVRCGVWATKNYKND